MNEVDLALPDGRTLHAYDTGEGDQVVFWHHGTPNVGTPPEPLFTPGVRWLSLDRPGYGGSTPLPERDVASVAADVAAVADAFGVDRFAVLGHSGGGPHALACAALLPGRVTAVASGAGLAPVDAAGLDWFVGMGPNSTLPAAAAGREARAAFSADDVDFTQADWATLKGPWSWFGPVVAAALANGADADVDDDLAYARPWGFDPAAIAVPALLVHGAEDLVVPAAHSEWLAGRIPDAELWLRPGEGHLSVLRDGAAIVDWLVSRS